MTLVDAVPGGRSVGTPSETKPEAPPLVLAKGLPEHMGTLYLFKEIDNAEAERFCAVLWAMANVLAQQQP